MNKATFFGDLGDVCQLSIRWIVKTCREYPIFPALYLIFFVFVCAHFFNQQLALPPPPEPASSSNKSSHSNFSRGHKDLPTAPTTAIVNVRSYRQGNNLIIRWDKPVTNQQILDTAFRVLPASCQPQSCTVQIDSQKIETVTAIWKQDSETFTTKFRL